MKNIFGILLSVLLINIAFGQENNFYEKKEFINGNDTLRYRIMYPINFKSNKQYPVVLFLHGSGERGSDNNLQLAWGARLFADSVNRAKYPAIVVFPQCPRNDFWAMLGMRREKDSLGGMFFYSESKPSKALNLVMQLMDSLANSGSVNTKKIYVGGLSMGGMGTFELLWRKPKFFAAALPICGAGDPGQVKIYGKNYPVWVFHGDQDPAVPVGNSRLMVNALKAAGAKVKYSEYPGVKHDSWNNAFAEPELLSWLFKQKRK